ncbi:MAG: hypothetical protein HRU14_14385 [Planctomycetes bacterium]|nr:hypothetical protein [Planctomycetota bacterium]
MDGLRGAGGGLVVMVKNGDQVTMAPGGDLLVQPGMILVIVGRASAVKALSALEAP